MILISRAAYFVVVESTKKTEIQGKVVLILHFVEPYHHLRVVVGALNALDFELRHPVANLCSVRELVEGDVDRLGNTLLEEVEELLVHVCGQILFV